MGRRGGDNGGENDGGWPPPEGTGRPDDLPELPSDWALRIPDTAAELAEESAAIRRELYGTEPSGGAGKPRPRARLERPAPAAGPVTTLPLLIVSVAIVATLMSLLALVWPGSRRTLPGTAENVNTSVVTPTLGTLPALDLLDSNGATISLRSLLPAVVMLTDGCACSDLVAETVAAVPGNVSVLTITRGNGSRASPPTPMASGARLLVDPTDELRGSLAVGPSTRAASVALVKRGGEVIRIVPAVISIEEYRADLRLLGG